MPVDIVSRSTRPVSSVLLKRAAERILYHAGRSDMELSILIVDDIEMAKINSLWLNRKGTTNVISFTQDEEGVLGDVVISADTAWREAVTAMYSPNVRLLELLVHGFVHLLGEDHVPGGEAERRMRRLEEDYLSVIQRGNVMADLCINVDHVATIREARGGLEPDPVMAAQMVELSGADGVVVHLREDRRHIQDRDVKIIREVCKTRLTLEMAATDEMISIATAVKPDIVTLVPERREELTTEGGLDVAGLGSSITNAVKRLHDVGIPVSLFVDPEPFQIEASVESGAECVELHTGRYADATDSEKQDSEFEQLVNMARIASESGLRVHAGHGLNYMNTGRLAAVSEIQEFSIGHSVISKSVFIGIERAVKEMLSIVRQGWY